MKKCITFLLLLAYSFAQNVPPFCKSCNCENTDNNKFQVTCTKKIGENLWNESYWKDENNVPYSYQSFTLRSSPMLSLVKEFPVSNITYLDLSQNSIENISDSAFKNLQDLVTLNLTNNVIEMLHPNAFQGIYADGAVYPLKSLRNLYLGYNQIHTLDADIFEHTQNIEILHLSHNPLKTIDQQTLIAICSLAYLKELDLSYTQLSALPDHMLHTPKYIKMLDLSGNLFEKVPETLQDSHNLEILYFSDNPIVDLAKENGFPNITTLKTLYLNNMNQLRNISKGALSNLGQLENLYCFDNPELVYIDENALSAKRDGEDAAKTWPPLRKLYLHNNKLTSIDMQLVLNWNHLRELDLTRNVWTCECENQWMVDELIPIYLSIDEEKARAMKCAAPIEMAELTFFDVYKKHSTMRCLDLYGNRPERDGALLVGILAGVLITIPLVLFIIYAYQRNWFGLFDSSPASYSRQFYKRTVSAEDGYF